MRFDSMAKRLDMSRRYESEIIKMAMVRTLSVLRVPCLFFISRNFYFLLEWVCQVAVSKD